MLSHSIVRAHKKKDYRLDAYISESFHSESIYMQQIIIKKTQTLALLPSKRDLKFYASLQVSGNWIERIIH